MSRVSNLFAHEGARLAATKREEDRRPEDSIFQIGMGSHTRRREFSSRPESEDTNSCEHQQNNDRNPAAKCTKAVEPFSESQPSDVKHRNKRETRQSEQEIVVAAIAQLLAVRECEQQTACAEVEHPREVREITHPIGPGSEEAGEVSERTLSPNVKAALLWIARGEFEH